MAVPDRPEPDAAIAVRLDVWLDVACVFRTRSAAATAIRSSHVAVNDAVAKAHRAVRPGDRITIREPGRVRLLEVVAVCDRHVARAEARSLYRDTTPAPDPAERHARVAERDPGAGRPTKRERRALELWRSRSR